MRLCSTLSSLRCVGGWSFLLLSKFCLLCVYKNIITLIRFIAVMFVLNYYQLSGSPCFCGRPLVSNVLAINTLEPSSNTLRPAMRLHPNQQQPLQLFVGHSLASTLTSYPGSFPVSCLVPRPCTQADFLFQALYPGSFSVSCLIPRLISCFVPHTQAHFLFPASYPGHFLFQASYPGSFPVLCLIPRLISCFVPRTQAHFLFPASYPGSFLYKKELSTSMCI